MMLDRSATISLAQAELRRRLAASGIASPALDARLLVMLATGLSHEALIAEPDRPVAPVEAERLRNLAQRRLAREPLSRIAGEREFYGRSFVIGPATLDPRPETETLVECALRFASAPHPLPAPAPLPLGRRELGAASAPLPPGGRGRGWGAPLRILDLGTGSGAILVSLLAELPQASGLGTDISGDALAIARENAQRYGLADRASFVSANWCSGLEGGEFDLIVSNPPYIAAPEIGCLEAEVRDHDPRPGLDGGPDGLDAYRAIAAGAGALLAAGGRLAVEIGAGQAAAVTAVFAEYGFAPAIEPPCCLDLAGHVRVLSFAKS